MIAAILMVWLIIVVFGLFLHALGGLAGRPISNRERQAFYEANTPDNLRRKALDAQRFKKT